jgi:calcineurin-like phosphoesterase family protein
MTNIWFTSDLHLNHGNIIIYTNRPFIKKGDLIDGNIYFPSKDGKDYEREKVWKTKHIKKERVEWMNETLIKNWNDIVNKDDVVYHLGDFCFKGTRGIAKELEDSLNGTIVHIKGNHDSNNGVKTILSKAILEFGGKVVLAQHKPPHISKEIPEWVDFVLCGHVHDNWKSTEIDEIPIINVGVDVWDYKPVSVNSLLKYYNKIKR